MTEMTTYVERAMTRLNTLTSAEAGSYGITAARYAPWRRDFLLSGLAATIAPRASENRPY